MKCSAQTLPRRIEPLQSGAWDVILIPEGGACILISSYKVVPLLVM
jgi:hypothetical protein